MQTLAELVFKISRQVYLIFLIYFCTVIVESISVLYVPDKLFSDKKVDQCQISLCLWVTLTTKKSIWDREGLDQLVNLVNVFIDCMSPGCQ